MDSIAQEFVRLGLPLAELPGLAFANQAAAEAFVTRLRALPAGATWHEVFPDLPAAFSSPRDQWQQRAYLPYGTWDHQSLPTAAAIHVMTRDDRTPIDISALEVEMRAAGLRVHGIGQHPALEASAAHVMVIMPALDSEDALAAALDWLDDHPQLKVAGVPRNGDESYGPSI